MQRRLRHPVRGDDPVEPSGLADRTAAAGDGNPLGCARLGEKLMYRLEEQDSRDSIDAKSFHHDLGVDNIKGRRRMRDSGVSNDDIDMV